MGPDPSESFRELRPLCIKVSKEPSSQNIKDLECKLRSVDPTHLTQLVEYVLFPLKLALQSTNATNELQETAVGCMETLFTRACICQLGTFEEMFNYLCMLLSSKDGGPGQVADIPEELKLAIVSCLSRLIQHTSLVVKGAFFSPRYLPVLGHSVSILLALAEKEKAKNLKLSALGCLVNHAFCIETKSDDHLEQGEDREALESAIKDSMSLTFASFVPGISLALCRVITGDNKQGHSVIMQAVELWGDVLSLVMNDKYVPIKPSENEDVISQLFALTVEGNSVGELTNEDANNSNSNSEKLDKIQSLKVNRTADWFRDTASKLKIVMERMNIISTHPNWKVRLSLVKFCDKLFTNCLESLQTCVSLMVDLVVGLTEDDYSQVASLSKTTLHKLSRRIGNGPSSLNSLLEENLHSALTSLPRVMRTADDARKIQSLNLVLGYMNLLGNRLSSLLNSSSHLKRLSLALVQVLEFDVGDVRIVEERTPSLSETAVVPSETKGENPMSYPVDQFSGSKYPTYRFKHFTDEKVKVAVNQVCHVLGCYGNLPLICDYFLDLFHESKLYQKQAVYILNEIVSGSSRSRVVKLETRHNGTEDDTSNVDSEARNPLEVQDAVELLITEYISDVNWNLMTSNPPLLHKPTLSDPQDFLSGKKDTKQIKILPFEVLNNNVQLSCLLLEAIGGFSKVCGSHFEHYLMKVLYPVMAKLGSENAAVSRSAYETLVKICQNCGYASVDELIGKNADYLVNSISLDFKYVFMNSQAPCVLRVMIQYSNPGILSIIEDTLMDVFSVIDLYPDELMYLLMKVLNVLVQLIRKWFPATDMKEPAEIVQHENKSSVSQDEKQTEQGREETALSADEIRQFFLDYHKQKQQSMGHLDSDSDESVTTEPESGGEVEEPFALDKKPEIPTHVKYVTQVLEKCVHFLSSKSPWLRLLVLDTIEAGILALSQSEDQLLPMIHCVWPSMVKRFTDDEQVVTIKAVNVLTTMAEISGTFMQRRVIKDAIPSMIQFLDKQAAVSLKAGPVYSQSQAFKLQLTILRSLGCLCRQLEISDANLSPVVWICSQYLSCGQPRELQQMAIAAFSNFASVEPDLIWLSLNDLYCPEELTPPHKAFKPIKFTGTGAQSKEFAENVTAVLSAI